MNQQKKKKETYKTWYLAKQLACLSLWTMVPEDGGKEGTMTQWHTVTSGIVL